MGRARKEPEEQPVEAETEQAPAEADSAEEAAAEEAAAAEAAPARVRAKKPSKPKAEKAKAKAPASTKRSRAGRKPIVRMPRPEHRRGKAKERRGTVVSNAMDKTIVVRVETVRADRAYKKVVRRSKKLHVHDEGNQASVGDVVRIVETRPLSKTKTWRLAEIIEAAR
jgi:small subunit ribosomal protein S17